MSRTLIAIVLIVFLCHFCCYAENDSNERPVLHIYSGENIVGQTLPPGTYRVVPSLNPEQSEVFTSLKLLEKDFSSPVSQSQKKPIPSSEPDTEFVTATIDKTSSKKPLPDKGLDTPIITDSEQNCEYGLPTRDGADCEIQLTSADLPAGFHLDDSANINKACEIHQWIMYGPDRNNRIEINISIWGPRAESYYKWKHGMLSTGQYSQMDLPIGNKQFYLEAKNDCNKQLVMQVGMYLVEMDRPPVEGITQQTDPIKREDFIAVAKGVENRIAAVAGIPPHDVMNGNPTTIRWRSVSWNVRLQNDALLQVQGAGTGTWGLEWKAVGSGTPAIVSWNGIGTGQGPVIVYQRSTNVWTVVLVNYATGALQNIHHFNQRVTPMSGGEYGATIRSGSKCYDYSWDHLKEIDCKSKNFVFSGTQSSSSATSNNDEPADAISTSPPDIKTPVSVGQSEKPKDKKDNQPTPVIPKNQIAAEEYPDWLNCLAVVADSNMNYDPWFLEFGDKVEIKLIRTDTGKQFYAEFMALQDFGKFIGNTYHATKSGSGQVIFRKYKIPYKPKGSNDIKTLDFDYDTSKEINTTFSVLVNPPLEPYSHWPSDKNMVATIITVKSAETRKVISGKGLYISLQGVNTPEITKESGPDESTIFTVGELDHLPPAIYTIYVYARTEVVASDLHAIKKYQIALPIQQGSCWRKTVFVDVAGKIFFPLVPPPKHMPSGDE